MTLGTGTGPRKRSWDRHAMVFSCFGSGRQSWQLQASKASFLAGSESDVRHWHRGLGRGRGPQARSVPQRLAVWLWRRRRFGSDSYSFLVSSESDVRHWGPVARRPGPSLRALLFWCGEGAVCEAWRLEDS